MLRSIHCLGLSSLKVQDAAYETPLIILRDSRPKGSITRLDFMESTLARRTSSKADAAILIETAYLPLLEVQGFRPSGPRVEVTILGITQAMNLPHLMLSNLTPWSVGVNAQYEALKSRILGPDVRS